jgi:hypothetical protein
MHEQKATAVIEIGIKKMRMSADDIFLWSTWIGVIALAIGVICACAIAVSGKIRDDRLKVELSRSEIKLAQMRADNLAMEKIAEPREFPVYGRNGDAVAINNELRDKFGGVKVWIQTVPDFESERLTVSLAGLFRAVNWSAVKVGSEDTGIGMLAIMEGVRILVKQQPQETLAQAADLLWKRLQMELGTNFFSVHVEPLPPPLEGAQFIPPDMSRLPSDTLLIVVGMKPISALLSEKNAMARGTAPAQ